jgi:hypothetical protein
MQAESTKLSPHEIGVLLRGEPGPIRSWTERLDPNRVGMHVGLIVLGAGLYGASMGWWRDPQQGIYTAIKFPTIILLTTIGNALLNAMLAPLLGLNIPFRQSFLAILASFSIAAIVLGSFSPLVGFMIWNVPPMSVGDWRTSNLTYAPILLTHVALIAFAGIAANVRLLQLLRQLSVSAAVAWRVLFAWLIGNLFFGSQLSWILRPFIGSPALPVQFLRPDAFQGNFYETVFRTTRWLLTPE